MFRTAVSLAVILAAAMSVWYVARVRGEHAGPAVGWRSTQPAGVAVIELFTSEGCSSCPPAEKLLGELTRAAGRDGRPVFTLAFHVDYWNQLGWADRFSDAAYSARQRQYARAFGLDEIYTPQMVVNGKAQFVGSDRAAAERAITDALATQAAAAMKVSVEGNPRGGYKVHVSMPGADAASVVNIAVVEQGLSTDIKSGENGGRRLEEPSVVRWFRTVPAADAGDIALPPLKGVRTDHASVIAYAQMSGNGPILGAAAASLP